MSALLHRMPIDSTDGSVQQTATRSRVLCINSIWTGPQSHLQYCTMLGSINRRIGSVHEIDGGWDNAAHLNPVQPLSLLYATNPAHSVQLPHRSGIAARPPPKRPRVASVHCSREAPARVPRSACRWPKALISRAVEATRDQRQHRNTSVVCPLVDAAAASRTPSVAVCYRLFRLQTR